MRWVARETDTLERASPCLEHPVPCPPGLHTPSLFLLAPRTQLKPRQCPCTFVRAEALLFRKRRQAFPESGLNQDLLSRLGPQGTTAGKGRSKAHFSYLKVPRGHSRDCVSSSPMATSHLVFVYCVLCGSVWDNSLRVGSALWE
ncbi:uncharacterized protein ACBT57_017648 [Dama dama]